jgi:site-specific DNA-cytosine methylase
MNVLVACECSGRVKTAFRNRGHNAWSLDLKPSEIPNDKYHYQGNMYDYEYDEFDLLIAHPDCTYLCVSGARWWKDRKKEQLEAIEFVQWISNLPVKKIAIENPIGILSTTWRKPDQIVQPYMFGHPTTKATCLWLKNLPKLIPTSLVMPLQHDVWMEAPSPDRKTNRARTYQGIANAMANQWG